MQHDFGCPRRTSFPSTNDVLRADAAADGWRPAAGRLREESAGAEWPSLAKWRDPVSRPIKSTFSGGAAPTPRRASVALAALLLVAALAAPAQAASVDNGDFETGDFTGWTTAQANVDGEWFVYSGTSAPLTGLVIPAPPQGGFAAVTDQADAGSQVLYRDLVLEPGFTGTLTFEWYYENRADVFVTPASLDPTAGSNQQYRVDLVSPSASPSRWPRDLIAHQGTHVGDPARRAWPVSRLTSFVGTIPPALAAVETEVTSRRASRCRSPRRPTRRRCPTRQRTRRPPRSPTARTAAARADRLAGHPSRTRSA
jgi:hypothetical protein